MRKLKLKLLFAPLLLIGINCFAQKTLARKRAYNFVIANYEVAEFNPVYAKQADRVDSLMKKALFQFLTDNRVKEKNNEIIEIISENSCSDYEDGQDYRRQKALSSICNSILYLTEKDNIYLKKAETLLLESSGEIVFGLENEFAGFKVLKLLISNKNSPVFYEELENIEKFVICNKNRLSNKAARELIKIINIYKKP